MLFAKNYSAAILAGIKGHGDFDPAVLSGLARADWNFQSDPECRIVRDGGATDSKKCLTAPRQNGVRAPKPCRIAIDPRWKRGLLFR